MLRDVVARNLEKSGSCCFSSQIHSLKRELIRFFRYGPARPCRVPGVPVSTGTRLNNGYSRGVGTNRYLATGKQIDYLVPAGAGGRFFFSKSL
jgi:hypothetical protein